MKSCSAVDKRLLYMYSLPMTNVYNVSYLKKLQVFMMQRVGTVLRLVVEELDVTRTCVFSVLYQLLNNVNGQIRHKHKAHAKKSAR